MNKIYSRINWENYPSDATPLNEANLNRLDVGLDGVDNRIIEQDALKASKEEISGLIREWQMDETTGIITITKVNGEQLVFDLNIEKIPVSFALSQDEILTMTTEDGTEFTADIGAMIPVLTFEASDTIAVSASGSGVNKTYSFTVKEGSVTEDKLQPDFLAQIKVEAAKAESSAGVSGTNAQQAASHAEEARSYSVGGTGTREGEDTDNARYYMEQAKAIAGGDYVTGIKGSAETDYRTGNVELSPADLGLGAVENKSSDAIRGELTLENVTDALGYTPADAANAITTGNIAQQSVKYAASAGSATTATKLGSSTVGGTAKPVYLNAGTATACNATVGNVNTPVYLNNGTITSTGKSFANYLPLSGGNMTGSLVVPSVELSSGTPFIDFHYNNSTADYTSRLIANMSGRLDCEGDFYVMGNIHNNSKLLCAGTWVIGADGGVNIADTSNSSYMPIYASSFVVSSSRLAKENIQPMPREEAEKILDIDVVDFDYKEEFGGSKRQHGVIAEDILNVIPSCVTVPEGYSEENFDLEKGIQNKVPSVDYSKLVPHLIKMVQLQQKQIEALRSEVADIRKSTVPGK